MVVDYIAISSAITLVLKNHEGRNTVTRSLQCGMITGVTVLGACVLLGPLGICVGAALGSTAAYAKYKNQFKSLLEVYENDMSDEEKMELMEEVNEFLSKLHWRDAQKLISLLSCDPISQKELFCLIRQLINTWKERQITLR